METTVLNYSRECKYSDLDSGACGWRDLLRGLHTLLSRAILVVGSQKLTHKPPEPSIYPLHICYIPTVRDHTYRNYGNYG